MAGTWLSISTAKTRTDAGGFKRPALWGKNPSRDILQTESDLSQWTL
jgi:hypothetical protein